MARPLPRRRRAVAATLVSGLAFGVLAPVTVSAPAGAAVDCLSEDADSVFDTRCDDEVPPETTLGSVTPAPNARGYLATNDVTVTFTGAHADADADAIAFQCQVFAAAEAPTAWSECTSPLQLTDLADTTDHPYTVRVRAVDTADASIDATAGGLLQPTPASTDLPDVDQTPAQTTFSVDTTVPNTFAVADLYDETSPDFPMVPSRNLSVNLSSNEAGVRFVCRLKGKNVPCQAGDHTFTKLPPGDQVLRVHTVDAAGNVDETPAELQFSVPRNLTKALGKGWEQVRAAAFFGGDVLVSTKRGATLDFKASKAKEIRILAPVVKGLGTLEIRIGEQQQFVPLKQTGQTAAVGVVYQRFFGRKFSGLITIRVASASAKKPAAVDAVLLH